MHNKNVRWLIAGVVALALALSMTGLAVASGFFSSTGTTDYGRMMGGYGGHGGMIDGGYGGMMGGSGLQGTPAVGVTSVSMTEQDVFRPAIIQVPVGATVSWTNTDSDPHTVTFMPMWVNSGDVPTGTTFSHTFTASGVYYYRCLYHPKMVGEVIVTAKSPINNELAEVVRV